MKRTVIKLAVVLVLTAGGLLTLSGCLPPRGPRPPLPPGPHPHPHPRPPVP